ncbi:MAG: ABC transporter permease [Candidatus Parabeggiatoa sp. nov. 3]|jgi:ABC-2 type transport system permease protein|nr:MAG: ABC transporter permease [Gammaproteobacteria bacterium]RKZ69369.1 MAG: ABC transporter permease [Gammaproteobacteria bacterium]RKZ90213.1 MAG: ABC transporter permease [Gammaproteobacteria bacterium]
MKHLWLTALLDISESLRARWFLLYTTVFGGLIILLLVFGLTESRVMGLTGLTRLLLTYISVCMAILPIFVLMSTVRSVAGDIDAGVFEYLLSLPVSLSAWYWGKLIGRFIVIFLPVFMAMVVAVGWGLWRDVTVPWHLLAFYTGLLVALAWCFLGIGMLISSMARSVDIAQGSAFFIWLFLLVFLDLILLGLMVREQFSAELLVFIALANPLQSFRTGAMLLFDPQLILLGPTAYVILDLFGQTGYLIWSFVYPVILGSLCAMMGYLLFRRGDLL